MPEEREFSIFEAMRENTSWDSEEAVSYEVAVEAVNAAIGAFSGRIAAEERRPDADQELLDKLRENIVWCARQRRGLDSRNHPQVATARRYFASLAQRVREGSSIEVDESWWQAR